MSTHARRGSVADAVMTDMEKKKTQAVAVASASPRPEYRIDVQLRIKDEQGQWRFRKFTRFARVCGSRQAERLALDCVRCHYYPALDTHDFEHLLYTETEPAVERDRYEAAHESIRSVNIHKFFPGELAAVWKQFVVIEEDVDSESTDV